jgi:threonine dehydrogenase-like Zn-dependent dehydrogenase
MLPGTKIYKLPDDMSLRLGSLSEPLTSCIRAFDRAARTGGFTWGDTVVIQGSGPIGVLAVAAAQEMGAGRLICVGAQESPRLQLARKFGVEATVNIEEFTTPEGRIARVRDIVGGFGADVVMDCSGHPSAGPEGVEMLRDGGTYVETGQFTDAGAIATNWHRICAKDLNVFGSLGFHRQRPTARSGHALSRPASASMARYADALSVLGRRSWRRHRRRHGYANGQVDNSAVAGTGRFLSSHRLARVPKRAHHRRG